MTDEPSKNSRQTDGTFATGNKQGKGRPEGSRNKASLMAEQHMEGDTEEVINAVIAKARDATR